MVIKSSLESIGDEVDRAKNSVRRSREEGWTKIIDESLLPEVLIGAEKQGRLNQLIEGVFDQALNINPNQYVVKEYMLDWLFTVGVYMIMEHGLDPQKEKFYEQSMMHVHGLERK